MDFASLMSKQIGKPTAKSIKRADVEAQRKEAYAKEQADLEAARLERLDKKRKRDEEEADRKRAQQEKRARLAEASKQIADEQAAAEDAVRRKKLGLPELVAQIEAVPENDIDDELLRSHLQSLDEPRVLFAESHVQRLQRYRALLEAQKRAHMTNGPIPTFLELVQEKDMKVSEILPKDDEGRLYLRRQLVSYFDLVLSEWDRALRGRSKDIKESSSGKQAYNNYATAVSNLTPLVRKLEEDEVPDELLKPIVEIVVLAQSKRYVDANNAYLRLSIGKAAWPIGVTMVGIHERSAREKLHEDGNAAHIMSDEVTRKMVQGIKRSLTFAQTRWPPDDFAQLMG